ncbi:MULTISPECIES: hypothetical protein [unclassified Hahella]|uniref:hypothetical protein n=1 Tax=unclassified Hahella TaxID=2624107 RepID=UPI001C1EF888|nr:MULTISPECIES: hypothetical protein [unclassified Hahella]MBU6952335.1 hypothetical protein [Hahella sp. HN01]MDG9668593.1 hypothetical protein [Hahella sp. CR1]
MKAHIFAALLALMMVMFQVFLMQNSSEKTVTQKTGEQENAHAAIQEVAFNFTWQEPQLLKAVDEQWN